MSGAGDTPADAIGGRGGRAPNRTRSPGGVGSAALDAGDASALAPRLDDEMVGWVAAEGGEDDLVHLDPEEMEGLGRLLALLLTFLPDEPGEGLPVGRPLGPTGELGVAVRHLGVDRGAVQSQSRVALEVPRRARVRHPAEPDLALPGRR